MTINRTQALVLGFFILVWASLVAIFALAPEVYYRALKLSSAGAGLLFLIAISAFIVLLGIGVSGAPWPAAVCYSPGHAGRLP
jgi:hypothetical protein